MLRGAGISGLRLRRDREEIALFSDEPIADSALDHFGFAAFAVALAGIIDNEKTATPLTIALSAPWGAGKTSVAGMLARRLHERVEARGGRRKRIICWFNAWEHADAPHLGAALAAQVARTANEHRSYWRRLLQPLPAAMLEPWERWWRAVWLGVVGLVLAAGLVVLPDTRALAEEYLHLEEPVVNGLGALGLLWLLALVWGFVYRSARNAARFIDEPSSEAARGSMAQVRKQLGRLIEQGTRGGRLVIFVDDLERCRAARAVQVFEVASQLLGQQGVVTILLADMRSLAAAAQAAYAEEAGTEELTIGRRYLEKLVQLELNLPPPTKEDMVRLLSNEAPAGTPEEEVEEFDPLEPLAALLSSGPITKGAALGASLGMLFALVLGLATFVFNEPASPDLLRFLGAVGSAAVVGGTVGAVGGLLYEVAEQDRRRRLEARVEDTLGRDPELVDAGAERVSALVKELAVQEKFEPLVRQTIDGYRTVRSEDVATVEAFIKRYPPPYPRGAKRMLNHARLLTKIARERAMFGGDPYLGPAHLGKWIVIGERWPELARRVSQRPGEIKAFENPGERKFGFEPDWPKDDLGASSLDFKRLMGEEPRLADVIDRLVYFEPADTPAIESVGSEPYDVVS